MKEKLQEASEMVCAPVCVQYACSYFCAERDHYDASCQPSRGLRDGDGCQGATPSERKSPREASGNALGGTTAIQNPNQARKLTIQHKLLLEATILDLQQRGTTEEEREGKAITFHDH